jgi:hypothetical protein
MMRAMRGVTLAAALLLLAGDSLAGSAPAARQALPRATADRPDEVRGPQLHVVYAVPNDGADRGLDTNGALESSVASFQRWLAAETGGATLRQDTFAGQLDVTFLRLQATDAEIASRGAYVRDALEQALRAAGRIAPDKLYAVYYDGSSTTACGGGAWPPTLPGVVAAMYLKGRPPGAPPCDTNTLAAPGAAPGYLDYGMLHELLHTLGAVPTCAPHGHQGGHVFDRTDDIMYAGTGRWEIPGKLDPGRDDYYGHGRADCFDLARSAYLTSNPPPPRTPALAARKPTLTGLRAGGTLTATLRVTLDGAAPPTGRPTCALRLRGKTLRLAGSSFARGKVTCRWRLPVSARGATATGTIGAVVGSRTISRPFAARVR